VIVWPRVKGWGDLPALGRAIRQLRRQPFDLAIDLQGLARSALPTCLARASQRLGVRSKEGSQLLMDQVIEVAEDVSLDPLMGKEYRAVLAALGLSRAAYNLQPPRDAEAEAEVTTWLQAQGLTQRPVVFVPCTTRPQKHWFPENWARLTELVHQAGQPVVVLGGPQDGAAAREIANLAAPMPVQIAAGEKRSLLWAFALLRASAGVVGVDTALTHAAIGVGRPTVALFGSTHPYLASDQPQARVLWSSMDCAPCRRHPTCDGAFTCMRLHTPERVWHHLQQMQERAR